MKSFAEELRAQLATELEEIGKENNAITKYDRSVIHVRGAIEELKSHIRANPFPDKAAEIACFKEIIPSFYSLLFFFLKVYHLEHYRQYSSPPTLISIFQQELQGIELFHFRHSDIYKYYYLGSSYGDDQFFTLAGRQQWHFDEVAAILDPDMTLGCYLVSWIKANELYRPWLETELEKLKNPTPPDLPTPSKAPVLTWTASHTDLVELVHAVHLAGSFNNGRADLKQVILWFEINLNIELSNYYNTFQEIARRKKTRTKFLDLLKDRLLLKMEEID